MAFIPALLPALSSLMLLTANPACMAQAPFDVDIRLAKRDAAYNTDYTSQQLTAQYGADPDSTLSTDGQWMVSGVTVVSAGGLAGQTLISFNTMTNYKNDTTCITVDKVEYEVQYAPKIFIASDYKNMGCRYSATLMHEKRHVQTDERTFTDFFPEIAKSIRHSVERIGAQGPFPKAMVPDAQKQVMARINADLQPVFQRMVEIRRKRQAEIDTEQNYLRDTALCPGQFPKFDGAK
ncbi:MAG TPA: hypothetical protein VEF76_11795 [Patescibacteria group bacterium]|nr:hypothetical protein [Patescibacteria group bacterium]